MRLQLGIIAGYLHRRRLNFEINAHNLIPAFPLDHACALAQLRKADMRALAQFEARSNQNAVNLEAGVSFKFKQDLDQARVTCTAAQNPTPASKDRAGKGFHHPARLVP
jgi:hypothetical protein